LWVYRNTWSNDFLEQFQNFARFGVAAQGLLGIEKFSINLEFKSPFGSRNEGE